MVRPRSPLRNFDRTCQALPTFVGYLSTTDTVTLISDAPAILTTVPETWTVNSSCPWKSAFAVYEKDGPWISTLPDCGGAISFTSFMFVDPSFKPRVHVVPLAICMVHSTASELS